MSPISTASEGGETEASGLGAVIEGERLPEARESLGEQLIKGSQRARILAAMADCCASRGFGATRIADIVAAAGVSRATFYELFRDKEECFCIAMEDSLADATAGIAAVVSPDKSWATTVRDAAAALLDFLASRPTFARMALVDAPCSGGERALELYMGSKHVVLMLLERGRDDPKREEAIPFGAGRAALGAAESLVVGQILAGSPARLRELLPDVVYILTLPYLGQDEALRESREAQELLLGADF